MTNREQPRHAKYAKRLAGLLFWKRIGGGSHDPLSTNWIVPANDNDEGGTDISSDCLYEIRPTVNELLRSFELGGEDFSEPYKAPWPLTGQVARKSRAGGLTIATESGSVDRPLGSIIGWTTTAGKNGWRPHEQYVKPKGGNESKKAAEDVRASNEFFATMFSTTPHRYIRGKTRRTVKRWPPYDLPRELRGITPLARARAWAGLPHIEIDSRPALPCGTRLAADSFIGHRVTKQVHQHVIPTNSPADRAESIEDETAIISAVVQQDTEILDRATNGFCRNFAELGEILGHTGKTAERAGRRALLRAADNLQKAINKIAA